MLTSLHVSAAGFQNTTSPGSIKDTNPKTKTVNRVNPAVGREQPVIERQQTTNGQPATNVATDTIPPRQDDSLVTTSRADTFSLKVAKDTMDAPVEYQAEDSAVLLVKEQKFILYGKTQTKYKTVTIDAPVTILDQETNILTAMSEKDSLGRMVTRAKFQDKEQVFESELFTYNFKTQKGITTNTFTKEGDFFVKANNAKKIDERTVFIREGYFTTCSYDDPHFAFKANKLKVISNSMAISGPTHPEFEGVPIPIYLPFGIFPLSQGRHSGFMAPQFTANQQFGLGLENFGYYHVLNDYVDVTMRASIYSYGGYNINITPQYRKRYRYNGLFNLSYNRTKFNFKGDPDYQVIKAFQINWSHSMDSKADPGVSFSANVNAGSTRFNEFLPNSPMRNFQNQLYSSITYSKTWKDKPFSLQLSANHNQNNTSRLINVILPDAGFTVSTLYPLQRKELVGTAKWYEKIGVGYNLVTRNQVSFYDTGQVSFRKILDTMQWGAQHRFPINIQLPPMGNFFVNPFISYEETWYTRRLSRTWNDALKKVDTVSIRKGIFTDRQLSFGLSFNTNVYGTFNFGKNSKIRAIRHVIRPTLSFNYKPNISRRSFDVIQTDASGRKLALPQFEGNMFPSYSYGRYGGITFGVDNNLEMKVRGKKDTADRKVRLIDGFGFSSGYNFLQDSLKLQPFSLYLRSTLFEKISISAQAQLDPYDVDPTTGQSLNRFVWANGRFTPGRITSGSISASTSFQSKPKDENKAKEDPRNKITDPTLLADQQRLMDYMQRNPAEFVDFNIAWSLNLSFSLAFNRTIKPDYSGYVTNISSSANFNSSFNLTPKWNFSTNGFYDFNTKQLQMFTMSISRDMHCWQMSIGVTPIGLYQYFNITISPKSSILKDLRVNRTRQFYNY
ncbi:MAG TPA: putative LPS assembly protein LptD [Flavisolibacter sp.]|nr:putative LPS assembly protein LptD [Flavisolibacter sp.]